MTKNVVVVESPSKAKTINKYLGSDYTVLASYGHVRDLPSKDGSVEPDADFAMHYEVDADSKKQMGAIAGALKGAQMLYLATDPDREGEAISWHVLEALKESKKLPKDIGVKRIAFHEITKKAITHAIEHPRDIDMNLVNAQQARRALDYLVGFNLSPVLWRKLPGSRSAGRVQSVALRLICEREAEIELFTAREYWDIGLVMQTGTGASFNARLTEYNGTKLDKFALGNEGAARDVERVLKSTDFRVTTITPRTVRRAPYPPFSTSTLQMEASRKLGFGAKRTMQVAQKLYEEGLITYMRTDGITVSVDAIADARRFIEKDYGANYVPDAPRMYKTKVKNAQEAHEAIRPTDLSKRADMLGDSEQARLYDLIWKRMVASQMEVALYDQVGVDMHDATKRHALRATGSVLKFDGFLCLYQETLEEDEKKPESDEESAEDTSQRLPAMEAGEPLRTSKVEAAQHFTQPPPRYSEASLVKRLEELGIGRPSTYASIISVLTDRNYVKLDKRRFTAEALGRIVTAFLMSYFERYVEYNFTANLEENLDKIADGEREWKEELRLFWTDFHAKVEDSKKLTISEVLTHVEALLEPYIFGTGEAAATAKTCPTCKTGSLHLKTGKFGSFLGCSNYPECNFTRQLTGSAADAANTGGGDGEEFPRTLGTDPVSGQTVTLRKGPYGVYVQLGEEKKPKRSSLPKGTLPSAVDLEKALSLLALPREVGLHPETGLTIVANLGRFGPYLLHDGKYANLGPEDDVLTIGMNRAVTLIAEAAEKKKNGGGRGGAPEPLKDLGAHPESGEKVVILKGRYGPYIKYAGKNITLPKEQKPEDATMESVLALLPAAGSKPATKKKPAARKPAVKKPAAKKTATKKAS
ncbi:MAG: type I DNA topoisomerase [Alphaproteobacteria bacterium]|nr:type I DNA topoisomerase [Alphaproteobacteria bacterium]